jgi:serine protease
LKATKVLALAGTISALALAASPALAQTESNEFFKNGNAMKLAHAGSNSHVAGTASVATEPMPYQGGQVQTAQKVYVVFYGSQWGTTGSNGLPTVDPAGEAPLYTSFISSLYGAGDNWSTSTTQYCSGVAVGTINCGTSGTHVTHPASSPLGGTWVDSGVKSPSRASDSQLASEAVRAAQHFGVSGTNVQIIVASPHGVKPNGFGTQYCAWHDNTTVNGVPTTFTNLPYISDAGSSCGASYVPVGSSGVSASTEGVTIVGGHEYAETVTDPLPEVKLAWVDPADSTTGGENGDKCAWSYGKSGIVALNGKNFAVQGLYSNNKGGTGGCDLYYNSATDQG